MSKNKYNVLIIGSGGREHALAWKCSQSSKVKKLYVIPGNAGTANIAINYNINILDFREISLFIKRNKINIVIIGPEEPLVKGIVDYLESEFKNTIIIVGPSQEASKLEGSKSWAKQFMLKYNIPTAPYHIVNKKNYYNGIEFFRSIDPPYVLKADGLAGGKGVYIANDLYEASIILKEYLDGKFGEASQLVVLEKFLRGKEVSFFSIVNGRNFILLPEAKDYKKAEDNDQGLNTGGMGAFSHVPYVSENTKQKIFNSIIYRTVYGLIKENIKYSGFIYFGLLIDELGNPYVLEYNVRLGDPEAQVILPKINSDIIDMIENIYIHKQPFKININNNYFVGVVLTSKGYPLNFETNKIIKFNFDLFKNDDFLIFFAGVKKENEKYYTSGGRVITIVSEAQTLMDAHSKVYDFISKNINFENIYFRTDIGKFF